MESYTWKITDKALIHQMKTAEEGELFYSPQFKSFNFTFELELYPNGYTDREGNVEIFLNICGLPPQVESIEIKRKYTFVEVDATDVIRNFTFRNEQMYYNSWSIGHVKTANIQKLNQMTF
eukprot:62318_1